jgi:hypothetical protein
MCAPNALYIVKAKGIRGDYYIVLKQILNLVLGSTL